MIPLYGFLEGDTLGILLLADESETIEELAAKLQRSSRLRVETRASVHVIYRGSLLDSKLLVGDAGLEALERIDVFGGEHPQHAQHAQHAASARNDAGSP